MSHLLVTNDFPPKVGGIQTYIWELWSRIDPSAYSVLTSSSDAAAATFDAEQAQQGIRITRVPSRMLLPTSRLSTTVRRAATNMGAELVVLDPALPVGAIGPRLGVPYAVLLHGAEVTVPARLPVAKRLLAHVLQGATLLIAAGGYPADEARRLLGHRTPQVVEIPPGVDTDALRPLTAARRSEIRKHMGVQNSDPLIVSVSRLVPRKGMDVLIQAVARLAPSFPGIRLEVAGDGRDRLRLARLLERSAAPGELLGRVSDEERAELLGAADVFVMACRSRWAGLEQEGFGIVFLEAAAAGVPQIAGRSGGAHEAVEDGVTGLVVDRPNDPAAVAAALRRLLGDDRLRTEMGAASRHRVEGSFAYDRLAPRLASALKEVGG